MIDLSGIRIPLTFLDGTDECEIACLRRASAKMLHVAEGSIATLERTKRSIDARKRNNIQITYAVRLSLKKGEPNAAKRCKTARISDPKPTWELPQTEEGLFDERPVVVGAGCAGLFCTLALANAGARPILIERGDDAERRTRAVTTFNETGVLDGESNIQFGLGGAGTFSDGKLQTGTKSPAHRLILETLARAGASNKILYDAKPHIGSDVLPSVVTDIVRQIEDTGGEVRFRTRLTSLEIRDNRVRGLTVEHEGTEEYLQTNHVVLACGHSARDVFEMLKASGVKLERKTFAMGVRIEHLQTDIDRALYGPSAGHPALGAAPYKLACHLDGGRSAFSFCMCPGGSVVAAASEPGGVVTNGMSLAARDGLNANSGLLANVFPEDLPGDDVLAGIASQRQCEEAAYAAGGDSFRAPVQLVGDFLQKAPSKAWGKVAPTYPRGVTMGSIDGLLPTYITDTLRSSLPLLARKLKGFDAKDALLTGVETRSSSPVRVTRNESLESESTQGLFPAGEGAGYAGGIMSAAADGLRVADAVIKSARERL